MSLSNCNRIVTPTSWVPLAMACLIGLLLSDPCPAAIEAPVAEAAESATPEVKKPETKKAQQEKKAEQEKQATAPAETPSSAKAISPSPSSENEGGEQEAKKDKPADKKTAKPKKTKRAKPKVQPKIRYAEFVFDGTLPESPGASGPFGDLKIDLRKLISRIDRAAEDRKVSGIVLRLREPAFGRGQQHEIRQAIARVRAAGKRVVAEMEVATVSGYLVACACDEIIMPESGFMLLTGIRVEPLFYKGLLAKLGVEADFVHVGDAKGAAEPYTRDAWSKPVKENLTSMVDNLYEQMVDTIAMERPMARAAVIDAIDQGLLTSTKALELGLIDRLAYSGELRGSLGKHHDSNRVFFIENYGQKKVDTDFSGPGGFFKLLGMMAGNNKQRKSRGDKIAIVYAVGPIMTGESDVDMFGKSESIGSTTLVEALGKAADDDETAAIVLRVNSPGGSAVASDLIWKKIQQIDKPVVTSMGDVAASGGYYIAMGTNHIFAEPTTITGSIGVVGGKVATRGLLNKLGVTSDLISRGKNSGLFSPYEKFTKNERVALVGMMEDTYDQFTAKAADGRGLTQDRIKELGGGRVYTGQQAKQLGLIDALGDLRAAVTEAKRLAGIDADTKVRIETYPEATDFFKSLFGGGGDEQREVRHMLNEAISLGGAAPELQEAVERLGMLRRVFAHEPAVLLMPFELE